MRAILISLLALGAVGGAAVALMPGEPDREADEPRGNLRPAEDQDLSALPLEQRVARLEQRVRELEATRRFEVRPGPSGSPADRLEEMELGEGPEGSPLASTVREIVAEEREREREERSERRRERFEQMASERLDELQEKLGLPDDKREQIDALWTQEREQLMTLFGEARSGDRDFRDVREQIGVLREQTDGRVQALMSESEFETYLELRPRGPGGRGGPTREGRGASRPE